VRKGEGRRMVRLGPQDPRPTPTLKKNWDRNWKECDFVIERRCLILLYQVHVGHGACNVPNTTSIEQALMRVCRLQRTLRKEESTHDTEQDDTRRTRTTGTGHNEVWTSQVDDEETEKDFPWLHEVVYYWWIKRDIDYGLLIINIVETCD